MSRPTEPPLPAHIAAELRKLQDRCRAGGYSDGDRWDCQMLDAYIFKLREAGWTLEAIGTAFGVTRERARQRALQATQAAYEAIPDVPLAKRMTPRPRKVRPPQMKPEFVEWLRHTYELAKECRGWQPLDAPERVASVNFWAAIDRASKQGITLADVARALGMKYPTLIMGLRRHGHRHNAPSQRSYRGVTLLGHSSTTTHCIHGHEFTPENTYVAPGKGGRQCRTCNRQRRRESYWRKKREQLATVTDLSKRRAS